ncbi:MAG: membrane protein insertion efficiency factor YidD [Candidatus Lambdaproteobacteria bacterium]|nr:membrane protein insertion efficiency factor YidD [Candidatus Lambdaproteobacteria bacterium]
MRTLAAGALLASALACAGGALAQEGPPAAGLRGPSAGSAPRLPLGIAQPKLYAVDAPELAAGAGQSFFQGLLGFYRTVISPVDGDRCSMAPTCSLYGRQALKRHGALLGIVLTADRLLHEADEVQHVRLIREGGETYSLDPLEANTYWLPEWMK